MPPFREGPIIVDRRFSGEALHAFRFIGHGYRVNIVDASYPVPHDAYNVSFPGTSADALLGIGRILPIEGPVIVMERDKKFTDLPDGHITEQASVAFENVLHRLNSGGVDIDVNPEWILREHGEPELAGYGFYNVADSAPKSLYVVTIDELPFACASFIVGHSQRTA